MLFHDPIYLLIFLPVVFCVYFLIPNNKINLRFYFLIISGLIFYAYWNIKLSPIIVVAILINFYFGKKISNNENLIYKKKILIISIIFNIFYLGFFKYADFVINNVNVIFNSNFELLNIPFPLALSFVTIQIIVFLVDCFEGNIEKNNIKRYSLFIIFFPQLIAGPIVRYNDMISQFEDKKKSSIIYKNICIGLIVISIGLIKKVLIADNLSVIVDGGFASNEQIGFFGSWLVTFSFAFQLYFDFSGYIDMATGSALLLNINLPQNFNSPFKANSIINFWQRWHITLTNFLTNYIYNPYLRSFKNLTFLKSMIGIMIVFLIAGLWHGPSWLFVIFGGLHGIGLIVNHIYRRFFSLKINNLFSQVLTFIYVCFSLIFFRAESLDDAVKIIKGLYSFNGNFDLLNLYIPTNSIIAFIISIFVCFVFINTNYIINQLNKRKLLD